MARREDLNDPNTTAYPGTTAPFYRRRSNWGWGLVTLVVILGVIAVVAWTWDYGEPVATGAVVPPPAAVPTAPAEPVAPVAPAPAPQ